MAAFLTAIEGHPRLVFFSLASVILLFIVSCTFNDALPICHYIFGCDHDFHR